MKFNLIKIGANIFFFFFRVILFSNLFMFFFSFVTVIFMNDCNESSNNCIDTNFICKNMIIK